MRVPLFKRVIITFLNIFFPPLAVLLLCGPNEDLLFNCLLFLLAVIPSHVHGFYISLTYFNRKRKARRGVYPGKWKRGIWSERVNTGGVGEKEAERLRREKEREKTLKKMQQQQARESGSSGGSRLGRILSGASGRENRGVEEWDDGNGGFYKEYERGDVALSPRVSRQSMAGTGRSSGRAALRTSHRGRREDRRRYYDEDLDY